MTRAESLAKARAVKAAKRKQRDRHAIALAEVSRESSGFYSGLNVNLQKIEEEYVPALRELKPRLELYDRMANDSKIKAMLRGNTLPLVSAVRWKVEGGTQEHRDLVAANLLRQGDPQYWCDTSWNHRLLEMMTCLKYGFSAFGKVWKTVGSYRVYASLPHLHARSFGGPIGPWEWNKAGRLTHAHRRYRTPGPNQEEITDERIEIDDLFLCVWDLTGENWEGVSMLRSMYRDWVENDIARKIQMINLQNVGVGIPDAELGPNDGKTDRETLVQMAKDLRGGSKERNFIVRANGQKLGFLTSQGGLDASPIIQDRNNNIASSATMDFMQQGQTTTGSRATGSVMVVPFMQVLNAFREILQSQVNEGAGYLTGLVEGLVDANSSKPVKEYPRIIGSQVSPTEQLDNIPLLGDSLQKGLITHTLKVENHTLRALGLEEMTQKEWEEAQKARQVTSIGGRPNEVGDFDRDDPRDDTNGRRYGLPDEDAAMRLQAQKKTLDAIRRRASGDSYPWVRSTAD